MTSIQYMDGNGVFIGSYQEGTPCEVAGATLAPADAQGFHGAEGLRWDGAEWVAYAPPPDSCTALQGRLALGQALCDQVAAMLPGMDWGARQAWEYATVWHRNSPLLVGIAAAFDMDAGEVDDLFRLAVTLEV